MRNVSAKDKGNCCSCHVCSLKCPKKCISMVEDEKGFYYPVADNELCVDCGVCLAVCPVERNFKVNVSEQECYSLISKDWNVIKRSSSGGAFSSLCNNFFKQGNGVVFGVTLTDAFNVEYAMARDVDACAAFGKSKYVKANTHEVFSLVEGELNKGNRVMFSGTLCSVAALKNYLRSENELLYTVDFVCHGTPSKKEFGAYLDSLGRIADFSFRYDDGRTNTNNRIVYENGKHRSYGAAVDDYLRAYDANLMQMEACFNCPWCDQNRCSDVTLGDFWGIERYDNNYKSGRGISLVLVNTEKGKGLFGEPSNAMVEARPVEVAVNGNPHLSHPPIKNPDADAFVKAMNESGFHDAVINTLGKYKGPSFNARIRGFVKKIIINVFKIKI